MLFAPVLLAPCATAETSGAAASVVARPDRVVATSSTTETASSQATTTPPAEVGEPEPPPPPPLEDPVLRVELEEAILSSLTPAQVEHLRAIAGQSEGGERVFAKLGGSSVVSRAFLHCFDSDRNLDLGEYEESLRPTVDFFREGRAPRRSPFARTSVAAAVGWSLRQGLAGRPSRILREVREIRPGYALVLFGGNDVQGRDEITFGERLDQVVEQLVGRNVIPILGAVLPRHDEREMDAWATRYNRMSRAVADAWGIPYIDYHRAVRDLPNAGLARDGVHPNVFIDGRRGRPCMLAGDGLRHGQNQRNLRTLQMLDLMRRHVVEGEPVETEDAPALAGEGTREAPLRLRSVPFAERRVASELAPEELPACEVGGRARFYRIRSEAPLALEVRVVGRRGAAPRAVVLDGESDGSCVARDERGVLAAELAAGVHRVAVVLDEDADASSSVLVSVHAQILEVDESEAGPAAAPGADER